MNVVTHDRYGAVPQRVQDEVAVRVAERTRHLSLIDEAEVEFDQEARRSQQPLQVVVITLRTRARRMSSIRTRQTGYRLEETVDLALHTIDREIDRLKDQLTAHP
jgi:ribosome-associated translation inhibitor RaiA